MCIYRTYGAFIAQRLFLCIEGLSCFYFFFLVHKSHILSFILLYFSPRTNGKTSFRRNISSFFNCNMTSSLCFN